MSQLSEADYDAVAFPELQALVGALDDVDSDAFEAELANDILTLEFEDGARFVINSHRAARQIWMAADRNAWHFDWLPEKKQWLAAKSGDELWGTLSRVVGQKLGRAITLARP
jgi:CyaY protein